MVCGLWAPPPNRSYPNRSFYPIRSSTQGGFRQHKAPLPTGPQSGATVPPQEGRATCISQCPFHPQIHTADVRFQAGVAGMWGLPSYSQAPLVGKKVYTRHSRLRIQGPGHTGCSSQRRAPWRDKQKTRWPLSPSSPSAFFIKQGCSSQRSEPLSLPHPTIQSSGAEVLSMEKGGPPRTMETDPL